MVLGVIMYIYWKNHQKAGLTRYGDQQYKDKLSSVHLSDKYTNLRTACNNRIPVNAEIIKETDVKNLPKELHHCKNCFK